MGKIKTTAIRTFSDDLMEKLPGKFTNDFAKNKEVLKALDITATKKTLNKIAGYITHEVKKKEEEEERLKAKKAEPKKKEVPVEEVPVED